MPVSSETSASLYETTLHNIQEDIVFIHPAVRIWNLTCQYSGRKLTASFVDRYK
jgi:hypothetical protein